MVARALGNFAHRSLTVSKPWVTVTAPHAAMPPAMKELLVSLVSVHSQAIASTYPSVVDMFTAYATLFSTTRSKPEQAGTFGYFVWHLHRAFMTKG
jgi:hypothetical protein